MPGTVAVSLTTNPHDTKAERLIRLDCVADAAAGTIPDTTLKGLTEYTLSEVKTVPGTGADEPTGAYRVYITESSEKYFLGDTRAVDTPESQGGHETYGYYKAIDNDLVVRIAQTAALTQANIGNEKEITVYLRFTRRF
jgi:hypothetical protein